MKVLTGVNQKETLEISALLEESLIGKTVAVNGTIHAIRDMGNVAFVVLRKREGLVQGVYQEGESEFDIKSIKEGDVIVTKGTLLKNEKAPNGIEIVMSKMEILATAAFPLPITINKWNMTTTLETKLNLRTISLRNIKERAKFKIQEGVVRGFRDFLFTQGFTEIRSPKIGAKSAEGGANIFKLDYFHKPAVLAQSPQFYKQIMVGVYDRVFECAPVFRAEKHSTKRHINEYTSLDFEMGYIDSFEDIMAMETATLQ